MTHKYETQCWFCGCSDLKPDDRGVVCLSCGATWNNLTNPGFPCVERDPAPLNVYDREKGRRARTPSKSFVKKVAKARDMYLVEVRPE